MSDDTSVPIADRTLSFTRIIDAPPSKVFDAWTKPELITQWFAPKPYTTPKAEIDLRVGGANNITMRSPEGQDMPNQGTYLEIVPNRKLVFTDAFSAGFVPNSGAPFMVGMIELEDAPGGKTKYTATVQHWTREATEQHKAMGFFEGWGQCTDQLNQLVSR